jgi:hypothetical protein
LNSQYFELFNQILWDGRIEKNPFFHEHLLKRNFVEVNKKVDFNLACCIVEITKSTNLRTRDKMKIQSQKQTPEGTCSGNAAGGLYHGTGVILRALLF